MVRGAFRRPRPRPSPYAPIPSPCRSSRFAGAVGGRTGAADGPCVAPGRRLADVKDIRDATVHGGRVTGPTPGAVGDERGEVTA